MRVPVGDVAARLAGLALTSADRLSPADVCDDAVRCGLLVDLALAGRLEETPDSVLLDTTPTGSGPHDALLAAMDSSPAASLDDWTARAPVGLPDVVAELVARGRWVRRRRWWSTTHRPVDDRGRRRDLDLLSVLDLRDTDARWDAADAAVAALASTAAMLGRNRERGHGLPAPEVPGRVLDATGPARWVVVGCVAHLARARQRRHWGSGILSVGGGPP